MGFRKKSTTIVPASSNATTAADLGLLALRVGAGSLFAAHGAQKLFGSFNGPGLDGIAGYLGSLGLKPAKTWAELACVSEFGGGTLLALGLGGPIGGIAMQGAMATAIRSTHWKLPLWANAGGSELNVLYALIGLSVAATGPGKFSLDNALGVKVPRALTVASLVGVAGGIALAEFQMARAKSQVPAEETTDSPE